MSIQYSKIAVIRIDKAGDLLLTTPALRVIKEQFPDSKTYLIASKQNSKVLINSELVDKIIVYDKNISFIKKLKLLIKIRKEKFDLCLVFSPINAAYYFCYLSKSKTKGVIIFTSRYKKIFNNLSYRFIPQIKKYLPDLDVEKLHLDQAGIRPKIKYSKGNEVTDFIFNWADEPGWLDLWGIESPGLTCSLAIGEYVYSLFGEKNFFN